MIVFENVSYFAKIQLFPNSFIQNAAKIIKTLPGVHLKDAEDSGLAYLMRVK